MPEADYFQKTPKKANRWFAIFIVLSVLFGITFSLASFLNWIFFLGAAYSLFMSYFLLPVQPKIFQGRPNRSQGSQFNTGNRGGAETVQDPAAQRKKVIIIFVSVFIFVTFVIPFLINVIEGFSEDDTTTSNEESADASNVSPDNSALDLAGRGNDFFNQQQYDSAEKYYDKAIETDPNYMEGYYGKGIVAYNRGKVDVANTYFLKAYEGGFRFGWLSWALADMSEKQGQTSRAIELYKESAELDSTNADNYKRLSELEPANQAKYRKLAEKYAN